MSEMLSILTHAPSQTVKLFVDDLIPQLGEIIVQQNRTGLVMVPATDSVDGTIFHLGEVLIAEAFVTVEGYKGYAACMGRDLEQALALAILDATQRGQLLTEQVNAFVAEQAQLLAEQEQQLLRQVEATRVNMETF
ncbi:MAG: phosphonate C-P lyase system protein PhnG [Phototrophicaceae bacterium]